VNKGAKPNVPGKEGRKERRKAGKKEGRKEDT
jgi:hypothetical protein